MFITINGRDCEAREGDTVLQAARRNSIAIPALCHHDALPGQACCRLCLVELIGERGSSLVVACAYPVAPGIRVVTESPEIAAHRRTVLTMLLEGAPEAAGLSELCLEYGVALDPRFCSDDGNKCILCGLCVRACQELGAGAISATSRGVDKKISAPFGQPPGDCVGCGACARVCPSDAIDITEQGHKQQIWGKSFDLVACEGCGRPVATQEELALLSKRGIAPEGPGVLCPRCRRKVAVSGF